MSSQVFSGTMPALMTPCGPDRRPDFDALVKMGKHLVGAGMSGLVYCGSMGDWPLLTIEQRMEGVERLAKAGLPVIVGTGAQNTEQAAALARHAKEKGARGLMIIPRVLSRGSSTAAQRGHFARVLKAAVDLPSVIYNSPYYGFQTRAELFFELRNEFPHLVGFKEFGGAESLSYAAEHIAGRSDDIALMVGVDTEVFHGFVNCGACGAITGIGNVFPHEVLRLVELCERAAKGDVEARRLALELDSALSPLSVFDEGVDLVLYFKRLMTLVGHDEYALHLNDFDALSRSQESMAKRRFTTFRAWYASWPGRQGLSAMRVIDSHTEGEPTRVIVDGGPPLGDGPLAGRRARFAGEFDHFRRFAVNEPRGHDAIVGALLCEPHDPSCAAGVIFFNNVGYLGMCGHGTIGLAVTLAHMGRLKPGRHRFETPVGVVGVELVDGCTATVENVESYRFAEAVEVEVAGLGAVRGDVAWGGNWFFLTSNAPCDLEFANVGPLTEAATAISDALRSPRRARQGRRLDRPHRVFRVRAIERREQPQFRPLPRRRLRPVAVRNRNQRQARLPPRRRKVAARRSLGAGKHHRQPLSRQLRTGSERRRSPAHQRTRVHLRRKQARAGRPGPVPVRIRSQEPLNHFFAW